MPLESPLAQRKDAQLTLRVPAAVRSALEHFSKRQGKRKLTELIEKVLLEAVEEMARKEGEVLVELRAELGGNVYVKEFFSLKPGQKPSSQEEEVLIEYFRKEGVDPSSLSPGLYVLRVELDNRLLETFVGLPPSA